MRGWQTVDVKLAGPGRTLLPHGDTLQAQHYGKENNLGPVIHRTFMPHSPKKNEQNLEQCTMCETQDQAKSGVPLGF